MKCRYGTVPYVQYMVTTSSLICFFIFYFFILSSVCQSFLDIKATRIYKYLTTDCCGGRTKVSTRIEATRNKQATPNHTTEMWGICLTLMEIYSTGSSGATIKSIEPGVPHSRAHQHNFHQNRRTGGNSRDCQLSYHADSED